MKAIKNLLCVLLAFSMLIPLGTAFAEEASQEIELEAISSENQKSIDMLTWLDVIDNNMADDPYSKVTRAELAAMVCKIVFGSKDGFYGSAANDVTSDTYLDILYNAVFEEEPGVYEDVKVSSSYYSAISSLKDMNIMVGYNNRFNPDDNVTYNEAVTTLISMLGYIVYADQNKNYPDEYLRVARNISLDKYVKDKSQHELNIAELAQLIYNAIHTDMVILKMSGNGAKYEIVEDSTPLTEYMGIYEGEGLFESTSSTALFDELTAKGIIKIDGKTYYGDMWEDFLGYYVNFYYREDDDTVVFMEKDKDVSQVEFMTYEIDSFVDNVYRFTKHNSLKSEKAVIENGAAVVYNGRVTKLLSGNELYIPKNGKVTLIDNDDNNKYDVVFIWSYETYIVRMVNISDTLTVTDYFEKPLSLSEANGDTMRFYKNGKAAAMSDIEVMNVLSVARSEENNGERLVTVLIEDEVVPGVASFNGDYIKIDGEEYPLSPEYNQERLTGIEYDFYLDALGQIVFYDKYSNSQNEYIYGIFVKINWDDVNETPPTVRVFTEDGEWLNLNLAEKITFDGEKIKDSFVLTQYDNALRTAQEGSIPQMIGFKLNRKKEVKEIDTVEMGENEDKWENLRSTRVYNREYNGKYLEMGRSFGEHTSLATETLLFRVPMTDDKKILYDISREKEFTVKTTTGDGNWQDQYDTYYVQFFNKSKAGACDLMIWYKPVGNDDLSTWDTMPIIIKNVSEELDEYNEIFVKINGWQDTGANVSFMVDETLVSEAKKLKKGDIVFYAINGDNEIASLTKFSPYEDYGKYSKTDYGSLKYGFVSALDSKYNVFRVCYDKNAIDKLSDECTTVHNMKGMAWQASRYEAHVMIYNRLNKTVRTGAWGDIYEGREILLMPRETAPSSVILFE